MAVILLIGLMTLKGLLETPPEHKKEAPKAEAAASQQAKPD
jgi:hypothetical protein